MKICEFCGTANNDDAVKCSSCGSNSFKFKCNNCGTEFNQGNFCPKCGVKVGQEERVCPKCNTKYFSAACPTCGYIPGKGNASATNSVPLTSVSTQPKRKTWLWVLGWIFIFPLPLTLILIKKPNMNKGLKYGIIIAAWLIYLLIGVGGMASKKDAPNPDKYIKPQETMIVAETKAVPATEKATEKATEPPKPTDPPTEAPTKAPTEAPTPIDFYEYTNSVDAGAEAFVTIKGAPNTEYRISVTYKSGSKADGLEPQITDDNGFTTWSWKVGTNTTSGEHSITVSGGGASNKTTFTVN